jgi:hypothetical protein
MASALTIFSISGSWPLAAQPLLGGARWSIEGSPLPTSQTPIAHRPGAFSWVGFADRDCGSKWKAAEGVCGFAIERGFASEEERRQ